MVLIADCILSADGSRLHEEIATVEKAGVSLNPATPLTLIEGILPGIDLLLIISANPWFGGQQFIKSTLPKIIKAWEMLNALPNKRLLEVINVGVI